MKTGGGDCYQKGKEKKRKMEESMNREGKRQNNENTKIDNKNVRKLKIA